MTESTSFLESEQTAADPPTSFLSLPSELRNKIYELSLVQEAQIRPWLHRDTFPTIDLLRASRTVHREASTMFYGQNRFDFSDTRPERVGSFLERIGKNNASYIRNITINFPDVLCHERFEVSLERETIGILEAVSSACESLMKITTSLYSTNYVEKRLNRLDDFKVASEALALVDARFRSIPSIQEIIVEVYDRAPSVRIREAMESHGWVIRTMGYKEMEYCDSDSGDFDGSDLAGLSESLY